MFVDFFFVLSGFVLAHAYFGRVGREVSVPRFLGLRLGRIYPLHLAVLLAMLALELLLVAVPALTERPAFAPGRSGGELIASLLLLNSSGVVDRLVWNGPSWSIAAEFWAYVAFALLALGRRVWPFALLGAGAGLALLALHPDLHEASFDFGTLRCLYGFSLGVLVWPMRGEPAWRPPVAVATLLSLFVAAIIGFTALVGRGRALLSRRPCSPAPRWSLPTMPGCSAGVARTAVRPDRHALLFHLHGPPVRAGRLIEGPARGIGGNRCARSTDGYGLDGGCGRAGDGRACDRRGRDAYRWIERPGRDWSRRKLRAPQVEAAAPTF